MKFFKLILCSVFLFTLVSCTSNTRKKEAMQSIEAHEVLPGNIFVSGGKLYIEYTFDGKTFYFTADLSAEAREEHGVSALATLSVEKAGRQGALPGAQEVIYVGGEWRKILEEVILSLLPENPGEGRLIFIQNYETVLLRRADGSPDLVELEKAPADVRIVGRVSDVEFRDLIYARLKQEVELSGVPYTRFLLKLKGVPLSPYMYVDITDDTVLQLQLPDYYDVQKEMTGLGFSVTFIYSFFVKSHLFGVIKAPFTSAHRLFSFGTSTIYAALPPKVWDLKEIPPLYEGDGMDLAEFNAWLDKKISRQNYKANVKLLIDGEEFFPHFILAMQRAAQSIFVQVYIFGTDPYALKIADLMKARAADGINVRVLTDELNTVLNSTKTPELKVREDFVMPKNIARYLRKHSSAKARTRLNTWANFDHTKVYIIDRQIAYTGGMNIGEEYRYTWHDMMVSLEGPVVGRLVKNFYETWSFAGWGGDFAAAYRKLFSKKYRDVNKETPGMIDVRLMYTKPNDPEIFDAQLEAIRRAKKYIYIQNAYFSDDRVVGELIKARGRGVDVRVILPGKNDIGIMYKNNLIMANRLFKNGIRVYFYKGMSHVKAAVYDGWAVVGSANFDKMSLFINNEMSLGITDPAFVQELNERLFEKDFAASEEVTAPVDTGWDFFLVDMLTNQL